MPNFVASPSAPCLAHTGMGPTATDAEPHVSRPRVIRPWEGPARVETDASALRRPSPATPRSVHVRRRRTDAQTPTRGEGWIDALGSRRGWREAPEGAELPSPRPDSERTESHVRRPVDCSAPAGLRSLRHRAIGPGG